MVEFQTLFTENIEMFRHPKYYKELRKLRNKTEQAISARETADDARAPGPGLVCASGRKASSDKPQATNDKPPAASRKPQATCDKPQATSRKPQAASYELRATRCLLRGESRLRPDLAAASTSSTGGGPSAGRPLLADGCNW